MAPGKRMKEPESPKAGVGVCIGCDDTDAAGKRQP